ncbi:MAG: SPASM domain-containing protein, partial [Candidatus Gastranaerophilales bacterium]|nr:SPASM domain-containing protein [Candidatus Gastranaerophilales bacterium]
NNLMEQPSFPLFDWIEIETLNRCNNDCSFCPVNRHVDPREFKKMDDELFNSIIMQLKDLDYAGNIAIYSNNEPLMDKRLVDFLKIAKENLPKANHFLFTNGTLITVDKFVEIMKYLDKLTIDNYNDDFVLNPPVKEISNFIKQHPEYQDKVVIDMRKKNEILSSRGGQANNRKNIYHLKSKCVLPFIQVIIRPDGKLSLCCNDALGDMTLGDLTKENLIDIWRGKKYTGIRKALLESRQNIDLCKNCDSIYRIFPGIK